MSKKVTNPNAKGGSGFLWAILAVVAIAAVVIGYIVFSGQGAKTAHLGEREQTTVEFESTVTDNAINLRSASATADTPVVDLYEDFSCPHCSTLAINTDASMHDAIDAGDLVVNVRTLNFLDRGNVDGHSTRSAAAVLAVANSGDAQLYWNYRAALLEEQTEIYNKWSNNDFADAAKQLGASDEVVDAIKNGEYQAQAEEMASANAELLQEETGSVSSPRVIQNGQDVDVADINQWVSAVVDS